MKSFLLIYLLSLAILITIYFLLRIHYKKLLSYLFFVIDEFFYQVSKFLYFQKDKIIKFEDFIEILNNPKEKFIKGFHSQPEDFNLFWQDYINTIQDLEKTINQIIIPIEKITQVEEVITSVINLKKVLKVIRFLICILTL
jgi:hypothetical protein